MRGGGERGKAVEYGFRFVLAVGKPVAWARTGHGASWSVFLGGEAELAKAGTAALADLILVSLARLLHVGRGKHACDSSKDSSSCHESAAKGGFLKKA